VKNSQIFRKKALAKLSSVEQLDQLMVVTSPYGWSALIGSSILVLTAILWGIFGSISTKVQGTGILIRSGGVFNIVSIGAGRLSELRVNVGEVVAAGEVVAMIDQPDLSDRIREAKAKLKQLEVQYELTDKSGSGDIKLQKESLRTQKNSLEHSIEVRAAEILWLKERIGIQEGLVDEGLITKQEVKDTQHKLNAAVMEIKQARDKLKDLSVKEFQLESQREQERLDIQQKIDEQEIVIASLIDKFKLETNVVSSHTGRILEIMVDKGDIIQPNSPLFSLELEGEDIKLLEVIIYVPAVDGKKVKKGMDIQISPATIKKEEYGAIKGTVTFVSDFPSTHNGMMRILNNDNLARMLSGSGAPIAIHANLLLNSNTISGLQWTSSKGPPTTIHSGTICSSYIVVKKQCPMSLVIPLMKKYLLGK